MLKEIYCKELLKIIVYTNEEPNEKPPRRAANVRENYRELTSSNS